MADSLLKKLKSCEDSLTPGKWAVKEEANGFHIIVPDDEPGTLYVAENVNQGEGSDARALCVLRNLLPEVIGALEIGKPFGERDDENEATS